MTIPYIMLKPLKAFVGKIAISGSFAVVFNFTCELYPTSIRATGFGLCSAGGRLGGIAAPQIILLQNKAKWLPNVVFGVFSLISGFVTFLLPETINKRLPQTIADLE